MVLDVEGGSLWGSGEGGRGGVGGGEGEGRWVWALEPHTCANKEEAESQYNVNIGAPLDSARTAQSNVSGRFRVRSNSSPLLSASYSPRTVPLHICCPTTRMRSASDPLPVNPKSVSMRATLLKNVPFIAP